MKKIIATAGLGLVLGLSAFAQQDAIYSQYMFNGITLNHGYAGNKGVLNFNGIYRRQWTGLPGSPTTMTFSVDGPIANRKMGLGFYAQSDKLGAESRTSAYGSYAYKVPVSFNYSVSFGLSFGLFQYSLDGLKLNFGDADDANSGTSAARPDAKFGVYFSSDNFYVGASVSNLLGQSLTITNGATTSTYKFSRHYYLTSGYIFRVNDFLKIYPSMLFKEDFLSPSDLDLNTFVLMNNTFWIGASYRSAVKLFKKTYDYSNVRQQNALLLIMQVYLNEKIRIGYAYDASISGLASYAGSTHEISLAYLLPVSRSLRMLSPRYF